MDTNLPINKAVEHAAIFEKELVGQIYCTLESRSKLVYDVIDAIRADKKIGRGSCSTIDECYDDNQLQAEIARILTKHPRMHRIANLVWEIKQIEKIHVDHLKDVEGMREDSRW